MFTPRSPAGRGMFVRFHLMTICFVFSGPVVSGSGVGRVGALIGTTWRRAVWHCRVYISFVLVKWFSLVNRFVGA